MLYLSRVDFSYFFTKTIRHSISKVCIVYGPSHSPMWFSEVFSFQTRNFSPVRYVSFATAGILCFSARFMRSCAKCFNIIHLASCAVSARSASDTWSIAGSRNVLRLENSPNTKAEGTNSSRWSVSFVSFTESARNTCGCSEEWSNLSFLYVSRRGLCYLSPIARLLCASTPLFSWVMSWSAASSANSFRNSEPSSVILWGGRPVYTECKYITIASYTASVDIWVGNKLLKIGWLHLQCAREVFHQGAWYQCMFWNGTAHLRVRLMQGRAAVH